MKYQAAPIEINKDYIYFLDVNGMNGRHVRLPSRSKTNNQIVVFGGFLSSAEKHFGMLEYLRDFGEVHYIDLPGYGGMDSLYKIDEFPLCDNYGDYIFSVLKTLKSINQPIVISLGSSITFISNLLVRHPTSRKRIKRVIHIDGIDADVSKSVYGDINKTSKSLLKLASKKVSINKLLYKKLIGTTDDAELSLEERELLEHLLSSNDLRTHVSIMNEDCYAENEPGNISESLKKSIFLINPNNGYKNFKLYDKNAVIEILPKQIESLLV